MELVNLEETRVEKFDIRNCILCKKNVLDEKLFTFTIPCCNMSICYGCWLKKLCFGNAKEGQVFGSCGNHNPEFLNCASYSIKESPCLRKIIECGCKDGPYYYREYGYVYNDYYSAYPEPEDCVLFSCWNKLGAFKFVKGTTRLERIQHLLNDYLDFDKKKLEIYKDFDENIMQLDIFTEVKIARLENVKSKLEKDFEEYCKNNTETIDIAEYDYERYLSHDKRDSPCFVFNDICPDKSDTKKFDVMESLRLSTNGDFDKVLLEVERKILAWQRNPKENGRASWVIDAILHTIDLRIEELQEKRQEFLQKVEKTKHEYSSVEMKEYQQEHQALKDMLDGKIDCDDSNTIHVLRKRFDKLCKMDFWWKVPRWYVRKVQYDNANYYTLEAHSLHNYYHCLYLKYFQKTLMMLSEDNKDIMWRDIKYQDDIEKETKKIIEELSIIY